MQTGKRGSHSVMNRRVALAGAGSAALGIAGGLSACAERGTAGPGSGVTSHQGSGTGAGSAGTVLGAAADIPLNGGRIFQVLEIVVTQPAPNDFRGFSSICTHTGCNVNEVKDGTINCPCHGSRYHLDGSVARGPAPRPLSIRSVRNADGRIILT